jgi:hypothetical protein
LKRLVAGGGFEPQVRIDSTQDIDSAIREIGTLGEKGKSFLHFSYTSVFEQAIEPLSPWSLLFSPFHPIVAFNAPFSLTLETMSIVSGLLSCFKLPIPSLRMVWSALLSVA